MLELDWEVGVYKALRGLYTWIAPHPPPFDAGRAATLASHEARLTAVAGLIAGEPVRLLPARDAGGVRGTDLLVPAAVDLLDDPQANFGLLLLRVAHTAAVRRRLRDSPVRVPNDEDQRVRWELRLAHEAGEALTEDLPAFADAWREACAAVATRRPDPATLSLRGAAIERWRQDLLRGFGPPPDHALLPAQGRGLPSPSVLLWGAPIADSGELGAGSADPRPPHSRPTTERQAPPVDEVRRVSLSQKEQDDQVLQHTFEKVESAERFNGRVRPADGVDELDEHLEALQEVELGDLLRGGDEAHSVLRAELGGVDVPDVEHIEAGETGVPYDEWDARRGVWRRAWCTVYPTRFRAQDPSWTRAALGRQRATIDRIRRQIDVERQRLRPCPRQRDGDQVDIDALVDAMADLRAGRGMPDAVYVRQQRRLRDTALTVLLDLSLSADAWVADRRVLDVSRDATLVLGELAEGFGDRFSVLGFASSTRNRCRVWTLKGWEERWDAARDRLGALEPQGYTRIGAALRHATAELSRQPAQRRLLVLISDGRPTDHDRYEGRYGMADVRMALREAHGLGIDARALAVDRTARDTLPAMFGPGGWELLSRPDDLPAALARIYGRVSTAR